MSGPRKSSLDFWVASAILCAILAWTAQVMLTPARTQWDLKVYMGCSRILAQGENPYLQEQIINDVSFPCLYPPLVIDAYRPFAALSDAWGRHAGQHLWSLLKILAIAGLLLLWKKYFWDLKFEPYHVLFLVLAYGTPFLTDFRCGNAAVFEQVMLWGAFAALAAGRDMLFGALIAAASLMKLTPLAFLPLLLLRPRPNWKIFAAAGALFAALLGCNEVLHPGLLREYFHQLVGVDQAWHHEAGPNNCSTYGFIKQGLEIWLGDRSRAVALAKTLFLPLAAIILALSLRAGRAILQDKSSPNATRKEMILFYCMVYALLVPRMKDYTFMLLLIPTLFILEAPISAKLRWAILLLAGANSAKGLAKSSGLGEWSFFFAYFKLYAAALCWWAYVKTASRLPDLSRSGPARSEPAAIRDLRSFLGD